MYNFYVFSGKKDSYFNLYIITDLNNNPLEKHLIEYVKKTDKQSITNKYSISGKTIDLQASTLNDCGSGGGGSGDPIGGDDFDNSSGGLITIFVYSPSSGTSGGNNCGDYIFSHHVTDDKGNIIGYIFVNNCGDYKYQKIQTTNKISYQSSVMTDCGGTSGNNMIMPTNDFDIFMLNFQTDQRLWLYQNLDMAFTFYNVYDSDSLVAFNAYSNLTNLLKNGQIDNNFAKWGIYFFKNNDGLSWEQFQNWFINGILDYKNSEDVDFASDLAGVSFDLEIAYQNGTLNQLDISWPNMESIKNKIKQKIKDNISVAVKYGRYLYSTLKVVTDNNPSILVYANKGIDKMRNEIHNEGLINYDVHTMKWKDLVACWLLELGNYPVKKYPQYTLSPNMPTLGFAGADYLISGVPNQLNQMRYLRAHKVLGNGTASPNSIIDLKNTAISNIKKNVLTPLSGEWHFGFDALVDTVKELDGLQYCLGSYQTNVYIAKINTNTYELTFIMENKTGWTSGTRGLNNYDGNSYNDSIIDDKERGKGLHLGGSIFQTYGWKETIIIQ